MMTSVSITFWEKIAFKLARKSVVKKTSDDFDTVYAVYSIYTLQEN